MSNVECDLDVASPVAAVFSMPLIVAPLFAPLLRCRSCRIRCETGTLAIESFNQVEIRLYSSISFPMQRLPSELSSEDFSHMV